MSTVAAQSAHEMQLHIHGEERRVPTERVHDDAFASITRGLKQCRKKLFTAVKEQPEQDTVSHNYRSRMKC